jgi:PKD repeat protein
MVAVMFGLNAIGQSGNVAKLEYEFLSSSSYIVHLDMVRNCAEDSLSPTQSLIFRNPGSGNVVTTSASLQSVTPISFYCSSALPGCQSANTSNQGLGRELIRYSDTISLSTGSVANLLGSDCKLEVWALGNRDSSNTAQLNSAVYTAWNTCLETASSPTTGHTLPGTIYEDRPLRYAPSISKANPSDSLTISLVSALDSIESNANYLSGFGSNQPFTPFCIPNTSCTPKPSSNPPEGVYFDARQGYFVAMPTVTGQVASLVYRYSWYRKINNSMQWIGTVHHESEFQIIKGGGNTPEIRVDNQDQLFHQKQFLMGKEGCFDVSVSDLDNNNNGSDTNQLFLTNSIANSSFRWLDSSAKSKVGRFCFIPDSTQLNEPIIANFKVVDDHCAIPEQASINVVLRSDSLQIRGKVREIIRCQEVSLAFDYTTSEFLPLNYQWNVDGLPAGSSDSIAFTASSTGSIPYTLTVTSLLSADTLVISDSVTVSTIFEASLEVKPANCSGDTVAIKPNISGGSSPYSSKWNGVESDSFTWVVNGDTSLVLEVSDDQGCSVTLHDTLRESTADIDLNGPDETCQNGMIFELTGTPVAGSWGVTGNVLVVEPDTLDAGLNQLPFKYVDSLGCVFVEVFDLNVLESPEVPIDSISLCRGEIQTLPTQDNGEWTGTGVISNTFYSDALDPGNHKIRYRATRANGCSIDDSVRVRVKAIPVVNMDPIAPLCKNSMPLVVRFEPKAAALSGLNVTDSTFTPGFELPDTVSLRVDFTAENGCFGSDSTLVVFKATPQAQFEGDPLWGDFPLTVAFNNLSDGGGTWYWDFGDPGSGASNFSNQRHPNHTYAFKGTYDVTLAATDPFSGCSDTLVIEGMIKATSDIENISEQAMSVYPIPFHEVLKINVVQSGNIQVIQPNGQLHLSTYLEAGIHSLSTSSWPSGIYWIQYRDQHRVYTVKVIKVD